MTSLVDFINITQLTTQTFSVSEAWSLIQPLAIYIVAMVIYTIIIFKFYRFVAHKNIFHLDLSGRSGAGAFFRGLLYVFEYLLFFPVLVFFWYLILTVMLIFLSKQPLETTLLISMSVVSTIRVTSYYKEELSRDIAKLLPFALLAVFVIDTSYFSFDTALANLQNIVGFWKVLLYYIVFIVLVEFVLRIITKIIGHDSSYESTGKRK